LRSCGYCGARTNSTVTSLPSYFDYWGGTNYGGCMFNDNCPVVTGWSNR
jgi:hypothetical protein